MPTFRQQYARALILIVIGIVMITAGVILCTFKPDLKNVWIALACAGIAVLVIGALLIAGSRPTSIEILETIKIRMDWIAQQREDSRQELDEQEKQKRESYAQDLPDNLLALEAFNIFQGAPDLSVIPTADPLVPMYMLDADYRILDWNEAFNLAFDYTMEGKRGIGVVDWIYHLENWREVIDHGNKVFGNATTVVRFDAEEIRYKSKIYGPMKAVKRAFNIPATDSEMRNSWLVLLDAEFEDPDMAHKFRSDLMTVLAYEQIWTNYSMSYDQLLLETPSYLELINIMLGSAKDKGIPPIPERAVVLDCGAGTGNVAIRIARDGPERMVYAFEKNRTMFQILDRKAREQGVLRGPDHEHGVVPVKQDITYLTGVPPNSCDVVMMNNVLYSVPNAPQALREAHRCLRPGGTLRVSGPKRTSNIDRVFRQLRRDLEDQKLPDGRTKFQKLGEDFRQVEEINKYWLSPILFRWNLPELVDLIKDAGFEKFLCTDEKAFYRGQGMVVCAQK